MEVLTDLCTLCFQMTWKCDVCTLVNNDDNAEKCDLCGSAKGAVAEDDDTNDEFLSLVDILRADPSAFDPKSLKVFGKILDSEAPGVVCDCIAYIRAKGMHTEGLFRVPGNVDIVEILKDAYENGIEDDVLTAKNVDGVHEVATLLKLYFRLLAEPLIPVETAHQLVGTMRERKNDHDAMIKSMQAIVEAIISPNRECLGFLVSFLREVVQFESVNQMNSRNLAICFAPSLIREPEDVAPELAMAMMGPSIGIIKTLIESDIKIPMPSASVVKQNTKHKPKGVVAPPPGMGRKARNPPGLTKE